MSNYEAGRPLLSAGASRCWWRIKSIPSMYFTGSPFCLGLCGVCLSWISAVRRQGNFKWVPRTREHQQDWQCNAWCQPLPHAHAGAPLRPHTRAIQRTRGAGSHSIRANRPSRTL